MDIIYNFCCIWKFILWHFSNFWIFTWFLATQPLHGEIVAQGHVAHFPWAQPWVQLKPWSRFYGPKISYFYQKSQNLGQKLENIGLKPHQRLLMATIVTLAAGRRVKLALKLDTIMEILTSHSKKLDFLQFCCYNKVTSKHF